jgi:excinuclease UvrABC helicase subunit UvrB
MDAKAEYVSRRMGHFLKHRQVTLAAQRLQAESAARLRDHLAELRSAKAQDD